MNNKMKYGIIAIIIIIVGIVAISSLLGSSSDNDPTHLVVTMPGHQNEEPETGFDPLTGWGYGGSNFNPLIQSTLLTYDTDGNFINDLATNYSISPDGLTWTVNIRDDVKFSNNESLTANDVAFTFNTAKISNSDVDMSNLDTATVINDTTVEFKLLEPQSTFIYHLRYLGIVPEKDYNNQTYGENPIGSGPYKLKQWDKGQQAIFEINENYYGDKPYFTQITMLFPEDNVALELIKSGEADVIQAPFTALNETIEGYTLVDMPSTRAQGLSLPYANDTGLKTTDGNPVGNNVTADPAIRHALNVGINRQVIADNVYKGHAVPDYTGVDSQKFANEQGKVTDNDTDKAKQILEEAGWVDTDGDGIREKNGTQASFTIVYQSNQEVRQTLATVIAEQAKDIGIDIQLEGTERDTVYTKMYSNAVLFQQSSDNPYRSIYQQYHSKENLSEDDYMNPNEYNNTEVDALLDSAMSSTDLNTSNKYWSQASYISNGSGFSPAGDAPWLWVVDYDFCYFIKDGINYTTGPSNGFDYMFDIVHWTRENTTT